MIIYGCEERKACIVSPNRIPLIVAIIFLTGCAAVLGPALGPGIELTERGQYKEATSYFEEQIAAGKTSAKLYRWAYESAFRAGDLSKAKDFYTAALTEGFEEDSLNSLAKDLWYDRAKMLMALDKWESAARSSEVISSLAPESNEAKFCKLMMAGNSKYVRGKHKGMWDALDDFTRASNLDPSTGLPYLMLGRTRIKNDKTNYDAALEEYYKALEVEPEALFKTAAKAEIKKIENNKKKMEAFWGK